MHKGFAFCFLLLACRLGLTSADQPAVRLLESILTVVNSTGDHDLLVMALKHTGLDSTLDSPAESGKYTFFAIT
jgi:hypothetical protein